MDRKVAFLGIDTSCYTTSCALVGKEGELLAESRRLLKVKPGRRGLQQSEMVFQHTRALPELIETLPLDTYAIQGIGVSAFPRREEDSYMPAFLVGHGMGRSLSHALQVPLYEFSHQENHILAAVCDLGGLLQEPFYSLHVSGGTTELLYCEPQGDELFTATLISGSIDLHGGQFVDRMGVALGLQFPAGPHLESLVRNAYPDAKRWEEAPLDKPLPVAVKAGQMSFGGPCSEAMRRLERGEYEPAELGLAVFRCISESIVKFLTYYNKQKRAKHLIAVGGVMCNYYLRQALCDYGVKEGVQLHFADPKYSSDNATGVAYGASLFNKKAILP